MNITLPTKLAVACAALLALLPGCAPNNSKPVFSDVPGIPSSPPAESAQPPEPAPSAAPIAPVAPAAPAAQPFQPLPGGTPEYVYVGGEFKHPGSFVWTNGMTLRDGIEAAGGFTDFARRRLFLYHTDGLAERIRLGPNFSVTNNPTLRPGDKLVSPRD